MSSYSPHASRPSTFRAPGWGTLASLSSCCCWRNATSQKLVPFSHRSASRICIRQPDRIPSSVFTQDDDHQFDGGEKRAGLRSWSRPQLQGSSSSLLGRRARRAGALPPARVGGPPLLPASGGGNRPLALRRRRPPAMPGKANCCRPARMQHSALFLVFAARTAARMRRAMMEARMERERRLSRASRRKRLTSLLGWTPKSKMPPLGRRARASSR